MLTVRYEKLVPFPFEEVLSQYFDYEHIAHVHPDTLGEYRLVSNDGRRIVYEQSWPRRRGRRRRSLVAQTFTSRHRIRFDFLEGLYKGVVVETHLEDRGDETLVIETYGIPQLPDWGWLRRLALPAIARRVDLVWKEDVDVEVCHGGWPGLPRELQLAVMGDPQPVPSGGSPAGGGIELCDETSVVAGCGLRVPADGREIALFRHEGDIHALENRCPHSGGPLALGGCDDDGVVRCPWHGARFDVRSGAHLSGPGETGAEPVPVRIRAGKVVVDPAEGPSEPSDLSR